MAQNPARGDSKGLTFPCLRRPPILASIRARAGRSHRFLDNEARLQAPVAPRAGAFCWTAPSRAVRIAQVAPAGENLMGLFLLGIVAAVVVVVAAVIALAVVWGSGGK